MPPSNRRRGGTFGGSLLGVPAQLPDDGDQTTEPEQPDPAPADEAPAPPPNLAPVHVANEPAPAVEAQTVESLPPPGEEPRAKPTGVKRDRPPATIRLDERAGGGLWDAYLEAKAADPFLSYRQFASGVVLDGLDRRRKRRS